jgi:hypothetical protein
MEISYFSTNRDMGEDKLLRAMKEALPEKQIATFSDVEKLKDELQFRAGSKTVAVLVALTEEALLDIYCVHYIFHGISTILILPDNDECLQALAFRMKPNFLFYADSKEKDIVSMLTGMTDDTRKTTTINERRMRNAA